MSNSNNPSGTAHSKADLRNPWWENRLLLALLCALTALPMAITSLPPLVDLYGHLGRYKVALDLASSPLLRQNWDYHWKLIANLGVDLLILPLAPLFGLERAIWLIALALPPVAAWGFLRVARAAWGSPPPSFVATLPLAAAYPYQMGFLNYWLSFALAFHTFASWLGASKGRSVLVQGMFALASIVLWVCHAFGWGILTVMVGASELARLWREGERNVAAFVRKLLLRCWPVLVPIPLMVLWRSNGQGPLTERWFDLQNKFWALLFTLRDQARLLDLVSVVAISLLVAAGVATRRDIVDGRLAFTAAVLFSLFLLLPFLLFSSAYVDVRILPAAFACALLALGAHPTAPRWNTFIAGAALALFLTRIAVSTAGFYDHDRTAERHLRALDFIEPGSKVVALVGRACGGWRLPRTEHLPSLAIVRREAFVNDQWSTIGGHLIVPLGGRGTPYNNSDSLVFKDSGCDGRYTDEIRTRVADIPNNRFDYLWIIDVSPAQVPASPRLRLLYNDEATSLFAIKPVASPPAAALQQR